MTSLKIGTRGSELALWQAHHVRDLLLALPDVTDVELVIIKTQGDRILDRPLAEIGGKGLFVKEIEEALSRGDVDLAVHSCKDMPVEQPEGLVLAAFPEREVPFDAFCPTVDGQRLEDLAEGARIGTGSLRRGRLLKNFRPDFEIVGVRGNVGTRLTRRFDAGLGLSGVVLAEAGLRRLGLWEGGGFSRLEMPHFIPAPAQGILAVETRQAGSARDIVAELDNLPVRFEAQLERTVLAMIEGNCHTPFAVNAQVDATTRRVKASAILMEDDDTAPKTASIDAQADELNYAWAERFGRELGGRLLA